jgi:hypothetical protein
LARPGAFKSEKRKKELMRQQKQEKKRLRRLGKDMGSEEVPAENGSIECLSTENTDATEETKESVGQQPAG